MHSKRRAILVCLTMACIGACDRSGSPASKPASSSPASNITPTLWKDFSGEKAFEHVRAQVNFGPRPSGTAALERCRQQIITSLKEAGWESKRQEFEANPVPGQGSLKFVNVIARFPGGAGKDAQRVIIGSHYDTKRIAGVNFVGADDGASSTGALLELARVLATKPALAKQVELVFFDGEEAIESFGDAESGPDGLVGSRHYATVLRNSGRAKQFRYAVVWDMIGDKSLNLTLPTDTPRELVDKVVAAGDYVGANRYVGFFHDAILDDHATIATIAKIPAMDMIDFDYAPWHTSGDTLDQLSPASLQTVGQLTLWFLERDFSQ